jgi:hypothetical protein
MAEMTEPVEVRSRGGWPSGRAVAATAGLTAVNLIVLMLALDRVASRYPGGEIDTEVFDGYFLVVVVVGLVNGAALACFRPTRHVGVGVAVGVIAGALVLSVGSFVVAASSGSLA